MKRIVWFLILFLFVCIGTWIEWKRRELFQGGDTLRIQEGFSVAEGTTLEEQVIAIYREVLQRPPNAQEMVDATRAITAGRWTLEGLKQRLIDSEEYERMIKLQSNDLAPELQKMISDKVLLDRIAAIYLEELKKAIPAHMVLPLKDAYVALQYNEYALRALLRSDNYKYLEADVKSATNMDKEAFMALMEKQVGSVDSIMEKGAVLAKEAEAARAAAAAASGTAIPPSALGTTPTGACPSDQVPRTVNDRDSDMSCMVEGILANSQRVFNRDEAAKMIQQQYTEEVKLPVHYGDMVLRPEMAWSVPQQPPPVCTTLGQKPLVQPVFTDSKLLLGTPLEEAKENTAVGSIMPAFQPSKEYVPIQVMKQNTCTANSAGSSK